MPGTTYRDSKVKEKGAARNAVTRADNVNTEYVYKARKLDYKFFEAEPDANARPIAKRLSSYPSVRGHCVERFRSTDTDIHVLLRETAKSAAKHNWRKVDAPSPETAFATYYIAINNINIPQPMGCRNRPARSAPPALKGVPDLLSTITLS